MNKLWTNLKSWYGVLFLVLLAGGVLWSVLNGMPYINNLRANWEAQRLQAQWENPTEKTNMVVKPRKKPTICFWRLFAKGDTNWRASILWLGKQEDWLKTLEEFKNQNSLADFIIELENNRKNMDKIR